jgi:hypothetical protein
MPINKGLKIYGLSIPKQNPTTGLKENFINDKTYE